MRISGSASSVPSPSVGPFGNITPSMARQPSPVIRDRLFVRSDEILYLIEKASGLTVARHGDYLLADRGIPGISTPQLALVEPNLDAGGS